MTSAHRTELSASWNFLRVIENIEHACLTGRHSINEG